MGTTAIPTDTERRTIEELNRQYLRAGEHGDVDWYGEHLADDFLSSAVDGSISDKAAFLKRIARGRAGSDFEAHDVRIRFVGELALVHAGFSCTKPGGQRGAGRYTDIYARRDGRWRCVSAHFNYF
ncbi:MAG TPA: nuclear transport factor 2 family protein [Burkholderiaceae bacterium]|nr:nuclear transport factor 2 family protein [Burkholderiaceae bacterium]